MDAERVEVLHVTNRDAIVKTVADHLVFHFFPSLQRFLHQHLRRERESLLHQHIQFFFIVAETRAQSAERVCRTDNDRIAQLPCRMAGIRRILHSFTLDGLHINLVEFLHKDFTVLRVDDGLHGSAQDFHAVFLENLVLIEGNTAVQCRLSAKGKHDAVRPFLFYHLLHEIGGDGQEVNLVGNAFRGLHGGNVRVDEDRVDAFLFQCFERLRAGIVKFSGLTDFQCAGTQQQDFLYIVFFHIVFLFDNKHLLFRVSMPS